MLLWLRRYWRIVVPPKTNEEIDAERWLLVCPLPGDRFGTCQCRPFYRHFILLAAVLAQFVCGVLFAMTAVSKPFELHLFGNSEPHTSLSVLGGVCVALAAAFVGPASERNGPRWSMAVGSAFVGAGLLLIQVAIWSAASSPLYFGAIGLSLGFGYIMVCSVATVQKWYPDLRGSAMGVCMFGFGTGQIAWNEAYLKIESHLDDTAAKNTLLFVLLLCIPVLGYCILAMRTPPATFRVNGHDMHGIPSDAVMSSDRIQGDYLNFGMTLVNYTAVTKPRSDAAAPGTERAYYEHVRGLTLVQCIFSTDFVCLTLAFAANTTIALLYVEVATPSQESLLTSWYGVSSSDANDFILHADIVGLAARVLCPVVSDVFLKVLYLNPAYARKLVFFLLLLIPTIVLPLLRPHLDDYAAFRAVIYVVKVCSGGGFALIGCFLTDLYGVYNMGTMYGLILTSWSIGMLIVSVVFSGLKEDFVVQMQLMWILSLVGLVCICFVRTDDMDRFFDGYQFSVCGRIVVQVPYSREVRRSTASAGPRSTTTPVGGIEDTMRSRQDDAFFIVSSDSETSYVV
ncbi:Major Facilitator Superfamily (MFS) [Achlya hypogyna]|uniref:Major Facilitator Superfamily (MFS) n=1 Tax=Achlya hypogyna TaxID=1202772 RepID=A0A1V9YLC2_ACHHY|nr:Major Facilitator Superfamily (MFS) [Achlya hypogyna]